MHAFDTLRLHLRPLREGDEALYCALYTDPELMHHIAAPMTLEAAQRSFRTAFKQQSPRRQLRIIRVRPDGADMGLVALFVDGDTAEMGVMLLRQAHGRGIATEAMAALRDRAFLQEGLRRLWIRQQASNRAVNPMMERLEFRQLPLDPALPHELRWALDLHDWTKRGQATAVAAPRA